jgi:hypothetical protein
VHPRPFPSEVVADLEHVQGPPVHRSWVGGRPPPLTAARPIIS